MEIKSNPYASSAQSTTNGVAAQNDSGEFSAALNDATNSELKTTKKRSKREVEQEATDAQIKAFFEKMKKDGGAQGYVVKMNLEKIEELIKKREEELKASYGVYNNPPLSPDQLKEALTAVKKGVEEYKKELLKELEEKAKAEKQNAAHGTTQPVVARPKITSLAELLSAI